jgi:UDP-N-acetylmuramoyl-tripeptide--D-alanyl-D-alanine ligase
MSIEILYDIYEKHPSVQTDSRKIQTGDIFFALKGPNFNGNLFVRNALDSGASYCVVDEETGIMDSRIIQVKDVLQTLQQLARKHREQFDIPFIAITGSNGKTTTKELIHAVLSSHYKAYTTEGNLNNHIGIPLTLLKIRKDAQIAVIEMGANHQKEIEGYCTYTMPTHGLITNCGKAHLEGFGGLEGIKKGKGELFDYLRENQGKVFIFQEYDYLQQMSTGIHSIVRYGTSQVADVQGLVDGVQNLLKVDMVKPDELDSIQTQLVGSYNLPNVLAAITVGLEFNVPIQKIKTALENYTPTNSRSQLLKIGGNTIILDAYNANPSSMKLAVENFANMSGTRKILMIGGMMELGEESDYEHNQLLELIGQYEWEAVVLVGPQFKNITDHYKHFSTSEEARDWLKEKNYQGVSLLIKGSRSMKMEKVLD